jgi:hypothetical protein
MSEHVSSTNRLYLPRKMRFSQRYIDDMTQLCHMLTNEVRALINQR